MAERNVFQEALWRWAIEKWPTANKADRCRRLAKKTKPKEGSWNELFKGKYSPSLETAIEIIKALEPDSEALSHKNLYKALLDSRGVELLRNIDPENIRSTNEKARSVLSILGVSVLQPPETNPYLARESSPILSVYSVDPGAAPLTPGVAKFLKARKIPPRAFSDQRGFPSPDEKTDEARSSVQTQAFYSTLSYGHINLSFQAGLPPDPDRQYEDHRAEPPKVSVLSAFHVHQVDQADWILGGCCRLCCKTCGDPERGHLVGTAGAGQTCFVPAGHEHAFAAFDGGEDGWSCLKVSAIYDPDALKGHFGARFLAGSRCVISPKPSFEVTER